MAEVYKELDEVKSELEKLKEDCRIKTEVSESLKRAHIEQQTKCQEAKLKIEKQEKELNVKSGEIVELRQLYDEVKSKLQETELSRKQVTSVNEKLRTESGEKVQRLEGENRKLVFALEEATTRNDDLEQKLHTCNKEIGGLKGRLSELQRKCSEAEEKARVGKELRHREDVIMKLEEQSMSVQDQLKWKKEQFQHLEEAHRRLQDQFKLSKKEWEFEKSAMLSEMTMLQSKLDSHIRITESIESQLKMCNHALAQEESRRKLLEVQLSESKQYFENVLAEYEEAKEKIESLSIKRDKDIADLRNSLSMKDVLLKEMNYRVTHLELENKELLGTVKELQEAQINRRKVDPSTAKLRNMLKDLEKVHSQCFVTLEEREVEWNSKMEKLIEDMKSYKSDVTRQNEEMRLLKTQLDHCHSTIDVSGEENSILLMVLKSELSDVYSKLFSLETQTEALCVQSGQKDSVSADSLDTGDNSPLKAESCLKQARMEIASLTEKLKSLKFLEKRGNVLENALEGHKKMLEESTQSQLCLKEQVRQMEDALRKVSTALEKSNKALTLKINEVSQAETELLLWKSKAESFRICLEQSQEVCKKLETSILEQVEIEKGLMKANEISQCNLKEQEQRINDLQQKIASLNQLLEQKEATVEETNLELAESLKKEGQLLQLVKERDEVVESLKKELKAVDSSNREAQSNFECEKEELCKIIREKNVAVENLGKQIEVLKLESVTTESERLGAEIKFEHEKEELSRVISEKDEMIRGLQDLASTFEQDFDEVFLFILCKDVENLLQITSHQEALQKTEFSMKVELETKNSAIDLLKLEVDNLGDKISLQQDSLLQSNKLVKELKALAEASKLEMEKLTEVFEVDRAKLKAMVKELEHKNKVATDSINSLFSERESMLIYIEGVCEQFGDLCMQDVELNGMLGKLMQNSGNGYTSMSGVELSGKVSAPGQKLVRKEIDSRLDRSPLRDRNQ
ncbi:hypothetical protein vseg_018518 [Gypsophila vaccaria]